MRDRRVERTRRLLQQALQELILERGYERLTVQDIIDRADVGRTTFYSHFLDKDDLFLSNFEALRTVFQEHFSAGPQSSPWEMTLKIFKHVEGHHAMYKALAGRQAGHMAVEHLRKMLLDQLSEHLQPRAERFKDGPIPQAVLAHWSVSSLISMLTWWLDHDLPYSAERMNEIYRILTEPGFISVFGTPLEQ